MQPHPAAVLPKTGPAVAWTSGILTGAQQESTAAALEVPALLFAVDIMRGSNVARIAAVGTALVTFVSTAGLMSPVML